MSGRKLEDKIRDSLKRALKRTRVPRDQAYLLRQLGRVEEAQVVEAKMHARGRTAAKVLNGFRLIPRKLDTTTA